MPTDSDSRKLERIEAALSNLEISADSVNLNTDGLEAKLDTANGILTTLSADTALLKTDVSDGVTINQPVDVRLKDGAGNNLTSTTFGSTRRLDVNLSSAGATSSAVPTTANLMGGTDGTNLRAISTDTSGRTLVGNIAGWNIPTHDFRSFSYTSGNLTGITYRTGGSGGTVVGTITLAYDGSGNLTSMTRT